MLPLHRLFRPSDICTESVQLQNVLPEVPGDHTYHPESDILYSEDQVPYSHLLHGSFLPLFCNHRFQEQGIPEEVHPWNTYGHFQDHMDFPKNRDRSKSVYNPFPNPGAFRNTDEANNHVRLPSSGRWYVPYGEKIFFSLCYI